LPLALLAAERLGIPADTELVKKLVRRVLFAISAKAAQPLLSIAQRGFAVQSKQRHGGPLSERGKDALPAAERRSVVTAGDMPLRRGKAKPVENVAQGERRGGTGDHRDLLRSYKLPKSVH
jgi:hypothetical protein